MMLLQPLGSRWRGQPAAYVYWYDSAMSYMLVSSIEIPHCETYDDSATELSITHWHCYFNDAIYSLNYSLQLQITFGPYVI